MGCTIPISIPIILRVFEWLFALITFSTAAGGMAGIMGSEPLLGSGSGSKTSFQFMVFTGVFGWLTVSIWIIYFHVFRRKSPHPFLGIAYDALMLLFTFCAAVAAASSDLNSETCTINTYKEYFQDILGGKCSTLRVAIAWCFFMSFCWIGSLIYSIRLYRIEKNEEQLFAKQTSGPVTSAQLAAQTASAPPPASGWDDDKAEDNENFI